jgi:hypothetical protein
VDGQGGNGHVKRMGVAGCKQRSTVCKVCSARGTSTRSLCWPAAATSQPLTCYIGRYTDALAGARCGARRRVSLDGTVAYKKVQVPETLQLGVWVAVLMMRQCQLGRSCSNEKGNAVSFSLQVGVPGIADDLMLGTNAHARLSTQAATARPGKHDAAAANRLPSPWPQSKPW